MRTPISIINDSTKYYRRIYFFLDFFKRFASAIAVDLYLHCVQITRNHCTLKRQNVNKSLQIHRPSNVFHKIIKTLSIYFFRFFFFLLAHAYRITECSELVCKRFERKIHVFMYYFESLWVLTERCYWTVRSMCFRHSHRIHYKHDIEL